MWHSIKDFYPGDNVQDILLYFGSSENVLLINKRIEKGQLFKSYQFISKPDSYLKTYPYTDWPTHWMEVKFPLV